MICNDCKVELVENTQKFDSTEQHLLGKDWIHLICESCGKGVHMKQALKIIPGKELPAELEAKLEKIKEKQEEIDFQMEYTQSLFEDEKLKKLMDKQQKLQEEVENKTIELGIPASETTTVELMNELKILVDSLGKEVPADIWGPDAFTKGKKDAIASKDGIWEILRSKRDERHIVPKLFIEKFPTVTNKMVEEGNIKITLKAAEDEIGKKEIESVCEHLVTYKYELNIKDGRNLPNGG
jgi:hypothetical protein